jgi:quercetin dioxygenase-like cupin family protein
MPLLIISTCSPLPCNAKGYKAGDVVVAHEGENHGFLNTGNAPLIFISAVSPALSEYELLSK